MTEANVRKEIHHVFTFQFERNYDPGFHFPLRKYSVVATCIAMALYCVLVHVGQIYMKNRPAYDLRRVVVVWNMALSLMSLFGFIRLFAELRFTLRRYGFKHSICTGNIVSEVTVDVVSSFWYYVSLILKFIELGDTAFLILRKKRLIFLHWFHHSSVLVFTFFMCYQQAPLCRWFGTMNYAVHAVMYGYFALTAAQIKIFRKYAMFVTCAQIAQMIAGVCLTICVFYLKYLGSENACDGMTSAAINAAATIYAIYFSLFLNFFFKTYLKTKPAAVHVKDH